MIDTGALLGLDIGGTLAKMVLFVPEDRANLLKEVAEHFATFFRERAEPISTTRFHRDESLNFVLAGLGAFYFTSFECVDMEQVVDVVVKYDLARGMKKLSIAGGGAHRFERLLTERLGVTVVKEDEIATIVSGVSFILENAGLGSGELYTIEHARFGEEDKMKIVPRECSVLYPFLLVNIGSGVSILEVKDMFDFSRVSGSALGGSTYWGLCKLLTKFESFDESMEAACSGDVNAVNLNVGDIYGGDYPEMGLPASLTASYFGKLTRMEHPRDTVQDADIAKALIQMTAQNITQLALLVSQARGIQRVVFTGNFLRRNRIALQIVSYSLAKWSALSSGGKGPLTEALFLRHEGFFGAMGAFLANHANAAGITTPAPVPTAGGATSGTTSVAASAPASPAPPAPPGTA